MGGIIVDADNNSFESTLAVNGPLVQVFGIFAKEENSILLRGTRKER